MPSDYVGSSTYEDRLDESFYVIVLWWVATYMFQPPSGHHLFLHHTRHTHQIIRADIVPVLFLHICDIVYNLFPKHAIF
jgi:hypothetical protein